jgi:hypothetical protein
MIGFARERVASGKSMPGVVAVRTDRPIGSVIDDLELLIVAAEPDEYDQRVVFIPL